ncbi:MAG TPA: hypothetical protein VF880_10365 [Actinomycetes bacterium]
MEVVATISAGISLVVSIVVAVKQARIAREQTAIQAKVAAIEAARRAEEIDARTRAQVTARIDHEEPPRPPHWLVVHNRGPALARGVNVDQDQRPQTPTVLGLEDPPVDLQPGQERRFVVPSGAMEIPVIWITVRWTDEAGDHEAPYTLQVT